MAWAMAILPVTALSAEDEFDQLDFPDACLKVLK
jgi:hypothetical protein